MFFISLRAGLISLRAGQIGPETSLFNDHIEPHRATSSHTPARSAVSGWTTGPVQTVRRIKPRFNSYRAVHNELRYIIRRILNDYYKRYVVTAKGRAVSILYEFFLEKLSVKKAMDQISCQIRKGNSKTSNNSKNSNYSPIYH